MLLESATLPALIRHQTEELGDEEALVHDGARIRYRELDQRSFELAQGPEHWSRCAAQT